MSGLEKEASIAILLSVSLSVMPPRVRPVKVSITLERNPAIDAVVNVGRLQYPLTSGNLRLQFALNKLLDMTFQKAQWGRALIENLRDKR